MHGADRLRHAHVQRLPVLVGERLDHGNDVADERGHVEALEVEVHLAGLDLGEVEHGVDQLQQVLARRVDLAEVVGELSGAEVGRLLLEHLAVADDRVERRAQLVRHVGDELGLVPVGRLELAALVLDLAEQPRVLDGHRRLAAERPEEVHHLRRELPRLPLGDGEAADQTMVVEQRNADERARARRQQHVAERAAVRARRRHVGNLDRLQGDGHAPGHAFTTTDRRPAGDRHHLLGEVVGGAEDEGLRALVVLVDRARLGAGELVGAGDDRPKHRLQVQGRAERLADLAERGELVDGSRERVGAGLQLGEEPRVLDGDRRLVGEGRQQVDLAVGEGLNLEPADEDHADHHPLAHHRDREDRAVHLRAVLVVGPTVLGIGLDVGDVHGATLEDGAARRRAPVATDRMARQELEPLARMPVAGHDAVHFVAQLVDHAALGAAQPRRALDQRVEHGLQVEPRAADQLEDLAGRGLLLQGHPELAVAGLQLGEQADVLDRDDRLLGEGLQQRDLLGGEWPRLAAPDADGADGGPLAEDRHAEDGSQRDRLSQRVGVVRVEVGVLDVHEPAIENGTPRGRGAVDGHRIGTMEGGDPRLVHAAHRGHPELPAPGQEHRAEGGVTEPARVLDDGLEDRLLVGRGAGDHPQDLARRRLLLEGLGEVGVPALQLGEQARVLDGDDGLVGEGLQQADLPVGERTHLLAAETG